MNAIVAIARLIGTCPARVLRTWHYALLIAAGLAIACLAPGAAYQPCTSHMLQ